MSPNRLGELTRRDVALLRTDEPIGSAVKRVVESQLPALPAVDDRDRFAGIFGEREFLAALFPAYLQQLGYAGFLPGSLDQALERRSSCRDEPVERYMTTDHVDVGPDYSDTQLAEIFLHHRVLLVPIVEDRRVTGAITRADFFQALARRFVASSE